MAQTSISGYFPVRKRKNGDHASIKRRKLTESARLDLPIVEDCSDTSSIPITKTTKVVTKSQKACGKKRSGRQSSRKTSKPKEVQTIKTLFDIIGQSSTDNQDESSTSVSTETSTVHLSASVGDHAPVSPLAAPSKPSPSPHPPVALSRGAALVEMAKQKMIDKSPSKTIRQTRSRTMASRRQVLSDPKPTCSSMSRSEVVDELYKMSAKDLALPTRYERTAKGKEEKRTPSLREFRTLEIESPTKNTSRVPAYQRFESLAKPELTVPCVDLPLPLNYRLLSDKFHCTDTIVNMLQKRREICTFKKLKRAVQEMSRRDFEQRNLAQMKTVYPSAFTFRQEKDIPGCYDDRSSYQLTVQCNTAAGEEFLNPTDLIKRRKCFQQNLTSIVKDHHRTFLSKLCPPITIPNEKVLRWHPDFKLDTLADVQESPLPQPPIKETYSGAAEVLKAAQSRLTQRVKDALCSAAVKSSEAVSNTVPEPQEAINNPALKGISQGLLDKIRAKEAAKALASITRDPIKEKQLEMVSRLPEMVRIMRAFFTSEKKAALLMEDVVAKLSESHPSRLAKDCVEEHLRYLCEVAPKWVCLVNIRKMKYIKIDRKADVKGVLEVVEAVRNKLRL